MTSSCDTWRKSCGTGSATAPALASIPKTQIVQGKTVCVVSCQRSPEPVYLKWKGMEAVPVGDFFVRSGPGSVKLPLASAKEYIRTRFGGLDRGKPSDASSEGVV